MGRLLLCEDEIVKMCKIVNAPGLEGRCSVAEIPVELECELLLS